MRLIRTVVAVLLAALLLPGSSHVLLEAWELIHQPRGAFAQAGSAAEHDHEHEAADGHLLGVSNQIRVEAWPPGAAVFPLSEFETDSVWPAMALGLSRGVAPPGTAPPEVIRRWQFVFRAALPARAPSLL